MSFDRTALTQFMGHVATADAGEEFQIDETWDYSVRGWRITIRLGGLALMLHAREARTMAERLEAAAGLPEWAGVRDWALDSAAKLRRAAQAAQRKGRALPDGGELAAITSAGRA